MTEENNTDETNTENESQTTSREKVDEFIPYAIFAVLIGIGAFIGGSLAFKLDQMNLILFSVSPTVLLLVVIWFMMDN